MQYLSAHQVKDILGYKKVDTIYKYIQSGKLKARKIGRTYLIKEEDIEKALTEVTPCDYTKEAKFTGTIFQSKAVALEIPLEQKIKNSLKNSLQK